MYHFLLQQHQKSKGILQLSFIVQKAVFDDNVTAMPIDKSGSVSTGADHLRKYGGLSTFEASHASVQNVEGCLRPYVAICDRL